MTRAVPFAAPLVTEDAVEAVTDVLRSGWIGTGRIAQLAEQELADYLGVPAAMVVSSGTAALHLALSALGVGPGDEVIVPTVTFTATAAAVVHAGATPVLVDVEEDTLLIDVAAVRRALTPRTRAVLAVHFTGRMADVRALRALCDAHGLLLVEDSAHALPAERDGVGPGILGDAAAFSFFVTKPLTSAEGGLLVLGPAKAMERARVLAQHGIDRDAYARHREFGRSPHYDVVAAGHKYNMPDTAAALLRTQVAKADQWYERRRSIAATYHTQLPAAQGLQLPAEDSEGNTSSWYLYVVQLPSGLDRDAVAEELARRGVGTSVHFRPLHQMSYYSRTFGVRREDFPRAEAAFPRLLSLPIFPAMTDEDTAHVVTEFTSLLKELGKE
ncbi:DegT/DnrJ/EryC1/StrS family aminotransferase [Streptomyces sp. NPDC056161]|uniref:DegT/DnrJ/EryC1/StrS family aminotransferase n=1 Tax=Streptomyces sp. NPDC056161 TaxID=3345732 RepID=UPI0035D63DA8